MGMDCGFEHPLGDESGDASEARREQPQPQMLNAAVAITRIRLKGTSQERPSYEARV